MPRFTALVSFDRTLANLMKERQTHADAVAHIDSIFAKYGISPAGAAPRKGRGRPPGSKSAPKASDGEGAANGRMGKGRRRRRFGQTAEDYVLSLLEGDKTVTTSEINGQWRESGRKGSADNTLTKLVKEKRLKRSPVKEGRGSMYSPA